MPATPAAPAASSSNAARLVGAWKLSRLDNVRPVDRPPWGPFALVYVFWPDGRSKHHAIGERDNNTYGRGNTPFKDFVPYRVEGDRLRCWLGLTNDLDPPQTLAFAGDDEVRITNEDGAVATLTRISRNPDAYDDPQLPCAGLTVRGEDYDESFVDYLRSAARRPADPGLKEKLVGAWALPKEMMAVQSEEVDAKGRRTVHPTPQELAAMPVPTLLFNADGSFAHGEVGSSEASPAGMYELHGDVMMLHQEDCGSWLRVRVEGGKLRVTHDGSAWEEFPRAP